MLRPGRGEIPRLEHVLYIEGIAHIGPSLGDQFWISSREQDCRRFCLGAGAGRQCDAPQMGRPEAKIQGPVVELDDNRL